MKKLLEESHRMDDSDAHKQGKIRDRQGSLCLEKGTVSASTGRFYRLLCHTGHDKTMKHYKKTITMLLTAAVLDSYDPFFTLKSKVKDNSRKDENVDLYMANNAFYG